MKYDCGKPLADRQYSSFEQRGGEQVDRPIDNVIAATYLPTHTQVGRRTPRVRVQRNYTHADLGAPMKQRPSHTTHQIHGATVRPP